MNGCPEKVMLELLIPLQGSGSTLRGYDCSSSVEYQTNAGIVNLLLAYLKA